MKRQPTLATFAFVAGLASMSGSASAQMTDDWKFRAIIYGYLPDIGGKTTFPAGNTSGSINVDASSIISNLKFTFMGFLEARKGRWGGFVDLLYLNVGGDSSKTRDVNVDGHPIPIGVTADLNLDIKGTILTLAGEYAAIPDPAASLDVLAGARLLSLKQTLGYTLSADVGNESGPGRSGNSEVKADQWDAIVGVKGRVGFGADREWFIPYYLDVGTGQSQLTWQAIAGVGYSYKWGQVIAAWRYLDYKFKSGTALESLNFNGPAVGVAFNW